MSFPIVPLGQLCDMDRQGLKPDDPATTHLPFVGVENIEPGTGSFTFSNGSRVGSQKSTTFRFDQRHILYAKLRPYLNKVATPDFAGKCSTELVPLLPRPSADRDFIAYLLRREETVDHVMNSVSGTRMPRTDMKMLLTLTVPLPPLDEQRRIVGILNRAAKIERLRAQAQERLREFIPTLFMKMFGDPAENPMRWKIQRLGELIQGFQGGRNLKAGSRASDFRILKVSAVTGGVFDPSMSKPAPEGYAAPNDHLVRIGDLLISRANTTALVGATAMVEHDAPGVLLPDKIWRFVWHKNSEIDPSYLHTFLQMSATRHALSSLATGTSGSMKNISQAKLKTLPVLLPPSEIQHRFAETVKVVASASALSKSSSTTGSTLSASLMPSLLEADA